MAVDFKLTKDGDLDLTDGVLRLTSNIEESSRQQILIVLNTNKGEWDFNIEFGVPYLANDNNAIQLLGAGDNTALLDLLIKQAILERENIVDIVSYESSFDKYKGEVTVSFSAETNTGEVITVNNTSFLA